MHEDTIVVLPVAVALPLAAIVGATVGSFINTALVRMPEGRSIVSGCSACDSCGRRLTFRELVPIVSYIAQRGKCRTCAAPIGRWQLVCELAGAGIALAALLAVSDGMTGLAAMVMGWQLLLLALLDARHLWLPTRLTAVLAGSGLVAAIVRSHDPGTLAVALGGGAIGYAMLALVAAIYRRSRGRDGMGQGDPPLMGAVGLWLGPLGVVEVLLGASIIGIVGAIALMLAGRKVDGREVAADTALPLGTCIAVAAWPLFLLQGFG
ncbi:prepilin peptidase [Novosphingobium lentum]|uniref:prepilin peptidase n=1 Tax=Novosphingobium lentum TaxID=145287 RepID=UPI0008371C1E|nr:A24 family peptidase [Novosphingobium lentum]